MRTSRGATLAAAAILIIGAVSVDVILSACDRAPTAPTTTVQNVDVQIIADRMLIYRAAPALRGPLTVSFSNQDTVVHDIRSDPHPGHDGCVELNIGVLQPGGRIVSPEIPPPPADKTCGWHDETRLGDANFVGSIVILSR